MKDPYEILGVERRATDAEIKKAYRRLARKHHPDVNPGDASAQKKFQEIAAAYELLKDPKRRQRYDATGDTGDVPPGGDASRRRARRSAGPGGGARRVPVVGRLRRPLLRALLARRRRRLRHGALPGGGGRRRGGVPDGAVPRRRPRRDRDVPGPDPAALPPLRRLRARAATRPAPSATAAATVVENEKLTVRIPGGRRDRLEDPGARQGPLRGGRPLPLAHGRAAPLLLAGGRRHLRGGPGHGRRGLPRRRDRRADDPGPGPREDPARDGERAAVPAQGLRRREHADRHRRATTTTASRS